MNKVVVNIKTDPETKEAAQALASRLGLTLSGLINVQLKQLINRRQLVLDVPFPSQPVSPKLERELDQVYQEVKDGQVSQTHTNLSDFLDDLNKPLDE